MSSSYAIKKGARYRYYISCVVQQGRKEDAGSVPRVAAHDVEGIVMNTLAALLPSEQDPDQASECERVERLVARVTVSRQAIEILFGQTERCDDESACRAMVTRNVPPQARCDPADRQHGNTTDPGGNRGSGC